ncbi:MAG TPA: hypothetical protein VFQ65_26275 [Kofleriaceae bacterium]|nr:hypothetical protein [Kofleriaceae bacterium]
MRALVLVVALIGCGSNDTGGHCTLGNACDDYSNGSASELATHEKECKALTGVWAKGSCPAKALGTCVTEKNVTRFYYGGADGYTKETATASCEHEFHGNWKSN